MKPLTLHYHEYGNKNAPLMVFLHGGGVSSWMWEKQVQYFTAYHCVTIDLPEQGLSNCTDKFSITNSSDKIIECIERIAKGKKVIVIGFSLGAQVLIDILCKKPNLIDYAMINSALVKPMRWGRKIIAPFIRLSYPLTKNRHFSKLQAKTLFIGDEYFERYFQESSQMECETLIRILNENMSFSIPDHFNQAKANILVTVGEKEKAVMQQSAIEIVNSLPNCRGIKITGIGHGISLANPELFHQIIENWLEGREMPKECQLIN